MLLFCRCPLSIYIKFSKLQGQDQLAGQMEEKYDSEEKHPKIAKIGEKSCGKNSSFPIIPNKAILFTYLHYRFRLFGLKLTEHWAVEIPKMSRAAGYIH